ncbi:hypothetical protein A5678_17420 [Mycobacterium sp. E2733]|nr:hypothetical protein A5678_17420 [Mycobacterium sp. E2733]
MAVVVSLLMVFAVAWGTRFVIDRRSTARPSQTAPGPSPTQNRLVSPAVPTASPPANSAPTNSTVLATDFSQLENKLQATMGIAVGAVGNGRDPLTLGDWRSGPAWSTMKVPLTIAALREEDPPQLTSEMTAAITESDNAAAESIWQSLGDPITAAHKVEDVLRETGDETTVQSRKVRPQFTAFGQSDWSLFNQARFMALAVCEKRNEPIFALMGQIEPGQDWGIGDISGTRFKGGWGPSPAGKYLVRQIGILSGPTGMVAVAVAAEPYSGSFADGTHDLTEVAHWLTSHIATLPAGHCGS